MSIFSYSLLLKLLKFRRLSLRLVFLIKIVYKQFLLLKNHRLWHSYCPSNQMRKSGDLLIAFQKQDKKKSSREKRKKRKRAQWFL